MNQPARQKTSNKIFKIILPLFVVSCIYGALIMSKTSFPILRKTNTSQEPEPREEILEFQLQPGLNPEAEIQQESRPVMMPEPASQPGLEQQQTSESKLQPENSIKKILRWNPLGELLDHVDIGGEYSQCPNKCLQCPEARCIMTDSHDKYPIEEYDAIIFLLFQDSPDQIQFPSKRLPNQIYIMEERQFPSNMPIWLKPEKFPNVFNWTMTFRKESDVRKEQNMIVPLTDPSLIEFYRTRNPAESKTRLLAWVVSHCVTPGKRENYVEELKKFIPVDIYGKCGDASCPGENSPDNTKFSSNTDCFNFIDKNYKFYLSFENNLCNGYITEKFFMRINEEIVPIVYGLADYSHFAPAHSYIDATNFKSVEDLAKYLQYLDKNDTAYNEYLSWKKDYSIIKPSGPTNQYCSLCKKLQAEPEPKVYKNLTEWFDTVSHCEYPEEDSYYLKPQI